MKRNLILPLFSLVLFIFIGPSELFSRDPDPDGGGAAVRVWERGFVKDLHENNGVGQTIIFFEVAWLPNGGDGEPDWLYESDTYYTSGSGYWLCEVYVPAEELIGNGELIWKMWMIQSLPGNVDHGTGPYGWNSNVRRYYDYDYPNDFPPSDFWVYDYRGYDEDRNEILDANEMPLAERFAPEMMPHSAHEWLAPEPVEIMGVAGNDIYIRLWDIAANLIGDYLLYEFAYFGDDDIVHIPISENCEGNCNYSNLYETMDDNGVYITEDNILRFDNGSGLWDSQNQQITPFPGVTIGIIHYEWAGIDGNNPNAWNNAYQNERSNNNYANTIYANLFRSGAQYVFQYWFFYPYNDFVNNHEGDWEHINVITNSQDPTTAELVRVDYYFHHKVQIRYYPDLEVVGGTHPIIYVGGTNSGYDGLHSGGNFPETGLWENVGAAGIDEYVLSRGPTMSYSSFIDGNPNDRRGIVILPDRDFIDYNQNPEMSWFKLDIMWGHLSVNDPWSWVPTYDGNQPPKGPYYNAGWNRIGSVPQGDDPYGYELYTGRP